MAKTASRLTRIMRSLRPGDIMTNFNCPVHQHHRVLVLASRGGAKFEFSLRFDKDPSIVRDPSGPYRWDDTEQTFMNDAGHDYGHIGPDTVVLEGAGLEQVEWYRSLPPPQADRFFINPQNLLGTVSEPGMLAKIQALLRRGGEEDDDGAQQVRNLSQVLDLIFAGTGALDTRRASLLHVVINAAVGAALAGQRHDDRHGGRDELRGLSGLLSALASGALGRHREEQPRHRGNGHARY